MEKIHIDSYSLNDECKKDEENKNEVINAFKNANEVICKSSIVSIKNGYKFEENKEYFVSNGENIFNLKRCSLK